MAAESRRSGNYMPTLWDDDYLQSITSVFMGNEYIQRADKLKEDLRVLLVGEIKRKNPLTQMVLVDVLQRLGISYHFTGYIDSMLENIFNMKDDHDQGLNSTDLQAMSLKFRLLRQHGYFIPQEDFSCLLDETAGNFKDDISNDIKGILSLYEASYVSMEGESIMDTARDFTTRHLKQYLQQQRQQQQLDPNLVAEISRSLELPLHSRMLRLEARWFMDEYETRQDMNPIVLEFAKLDYNLVQTMYQDELKELSKWYTNTRLAEKMSFARDRLVECFLWTIGLTFEPRFRYCRIMTVKLVILGTIIDDIYDVYGTIDELELFTLAVERWDINALEQLPDYMKICFLALFNSMNELSYDILKVQDFNGIPFLKEMWAKLCKSYLVEAKWCCNGYTPSLKEYIENALVSIAGPLILGNAYFCITNPIKKEALKDLVNLPSIIRGISTIARLTDDLGTSHDEMKRGDVAKSIQCHMHDTGCSEEEAREYVESLIYDTWKKVNKEIIVMNRSYSKDFVEASTNYVRIHQCMYQTGDGHGVPTQSKDRILSLIVEPIPLP